MSCARCGTDLVARARYCHQCGERAVPGALQLDNSQIVEERSGWRHLRTALFAVVGLAGLLWSTQGLWLGDDPVPTPIDDRRYASEPAPDVEPVKPVSQAQAWYALRKAKLRSSMTTEADNVVGNVARGEQVKGSVEIGLDGETSWLNTGTSGPYVAVVNLAEKAPKPLDLALDLTLETESVTALYTTPGDDLGFSVETVPVGTPLAISGVVGGWFEVLLKKGGTAYFKPGDKASKRAMAKALAVLDKSGDE